LPLLWWKYSYLLTGFVRPSFRGVERRLWSENRNDTSSGAYQALLARVGDQRQFL
jgi:hypothetical protein